MQDSETFLAMPKGFFYAKKITISRVHTDQAIANQHPIHGLHAKGNRAREVAGAPLLPGPLYFH